MSDQIAADSGVERMLPKMRESDTAVIVGRLGGLNVGYRRAGRGLYQEWPSKMAESVKRRPVTKGDEERLVGIRSSDPCHHAHNWIRK